jgi:tRNA threonylcarbamoyladenosine biosynthesis protein TsaB
MPGYCLEGRNLKAIRAERRQVRVIALETSGASGSLALLEGEGQPAVASDRQLPADQRTARSLLPCLREMLHERGWSPADADLVCVTTGPGSFTGLRLGVVTAKTFAYAVGAQLVGVHTLAAIAAGLGDASRRLWTVLDAQRGELFAAVFEPGASLADAHPPATEILTVHDWLLRLQPGDVVAGPPLAKLRHQLPPGVVVADEAAWAPTAVAAARLGLELLARRGGVNPMELTPRYYRRSAAEEKARPPR